MKRITLIALLLLAAQAGAAQVPGSDQRTPKEAPSSAQVLLDSLQRIWLDQTRPDTVRLAAFKDFISKGAFRSDPDSAFVLAGLLADTAAQWGRTYYVIGALNLQGCARAMKGDFSSAIEHFQRGLEQCRETRDTLSEIMILKNIGKCYFDVNEPYQSLQQSLRALELSGSTGDRMEAGIRCSMSMAYLAMADYANAEENARRAQVIAEQIQDKREMLYAARVLADILVAQDRGSEAMPYYERSLALADDLHDARSRVSALMGLSKLHAKRRAFDRAITYGQSALDLAKEGDDRTQIRNCHSVLYDVYKQAGRPAEALEMLEHFMEINDALINDENKAALVRQKVQADFDLKEAMLHAEQERKDAIAAQEIRRQKVVRYFYLGGALLLLVGGGAWYHADRKRRRERFEREAAELQTQVLRSQMNPHFIFNALNSINAFVQRNDADGASSYLSKFARVMRGVLENSRHREVALQDDLETLRGYMELERRRMDDKFDFTINVDPDIDPAQVMVPPLVVQPLVENAIWHGVATKEGRGCIAVKVEQVGDQLVWCIEDDGVGRGAAKPAAQPAMAGQGKPMKKTSLGTAITRNRLELLQQQYGGRAGFRYEDLVQGTRVVVDMPVIMA